MTLKTIFKKPVDRPIEGVIKADDDVSLRIEIEEYVLTDEVRKRLESFLDAYNNYKVANGVWVSGFFGSGKSHLLKMLAILLENREVEGSRALDLFLPKCEDNQIFRADLERAASIPSKSILFNIDQKADVISKSQIDALVAVFVKVFDEMSGYYGKQGHIAKFERDLDSRGQYDSFRASYQAIAGKEWEKGREQALLEGKNIADAYGVVSGASPELAIGILDKYRSEYRISIEDFADQVKAYLDKQPSNFRLNFFVDEVGQYIADNVKLMTNLQTIAESLATKCRGRAWVIVTAQEDMDAVVGEMGRQQSNDFSKIQARFANRMKLTSQDVAEVIQKRLLTKNVEGIGLLTEVYHQQQNNFKTLFDFADGSQTYRNFKDLDDFIHGYPFIPYQFGLFQASIQNLSQHNAFEGKNCSVGERSMLGVFQQVAIQISDREIGQLSTFDLMFEGIRTVLKSNIQQSILRAENNLDNPFAIRLLKTLFLVRYVKEFKPTLRNLCVLMLDSFDQDLPKLSKTVEEALNLLEQQTYIQRNGGQYIYLTDEEHDIEQEIKSTEVETSKVAEELEKLIFDSVIKTRKIRYIENNHDYDYSRKLDGKLHGREHELTIHVITPFDENMDNEAQLVMKSMGHNELLVVMPPDSRLVRDILMYKRADKYISQNSSITQSDTVKSILSIKRVQNGNLYTELNQLIKELLGKANLYVSGTKIEIGGEDAQTRIIRGFSELIGRAYPNLVMLRGINYTENDVVKYLKDSQQSLFGNDVTSLSEAEQEVLALIQSNNRNGVRTTLKALIDQFERKPYGWYYAAILCTIAKLCVRGKLEVRSDGNILEEDELARSLLNTQAHANVVLEPQLDYTTSQVRNLKEFYQDFFDAPPSASEAKALGKETGAAMQELLNQLSPLAAQVAQYPFLSALDPAIALLKNMKGKPYTWYLTELSTEEDRLIDLKEQVIAPIREFMNGQKKRIFDDAHKFVQVQEPNFTYIAGEESTQVKAVLADLECFKSNRMQQVKSLIENLQEKVAAQIKAEIATAQAKVTDLQARLCGMTEFTALTSEQQGQIVKPFGDFLATIARQQLIAVIRDTLRTFEDTEYQKALTRLSVWGVESEKLGVESEKGAKVLIVTKSPIEYVTKRSIQVKFDKAWLADEEDVNMYVESLREALLTEIEQGKRIQI